MLVPVAWQLIPLRASSRMPSITTIQRVRRGEQADSFRFVASNPASNASIPPTAVQSPSGPRPNVPGKGLCGQPRDDCCVVVATLRAAVAAVDPFSVTPGGENEQVVALGSMLLQLSNTTWLKPLDGVTVTV